MELDAFWPPTDFGVNVLGTTATLVATLAALFIAVRGWQREDRREETRRANGVCAWASVQFDGSYQRFLIELGNYTDLPVFDVRLSFWEWKENEQVESQRKFAILAPGQTIEVARGTDYCWDYEAQSAIDLTFRDLRGVRWKRTGVGVSKRLKD